MDDRRTNISQLAAEFGVSRPTLYNWAAKIRETLKHEKTPTPDRAGATEVNPKDSPTQTDDTRTVSGAVLNR
jgi:transposase-like protein